MTITSTKDFAPLAEIIFSMPPLPAPTVVVPLTARLKASAPKVVPLPTTKFPPMARLAALVAVALPLSVRLPLTVVIAPKVSGPPLKVRWWYVVTFSV